MHALSHLQSAFKMKANELPTARCLVSVKSDLTRINCTSLRGTQYNGGLSRPSSKQHSPHYKPVSPVFIYNPLYSLCLRQQKTSTLNCCTYTCLYANSTCRPAGSGDLRSMPKEKMCRNLQKWWKPLWWCVFCKGLLCGKLWVLKTGKYVSQWLTTESFGKKMYWNNRKQF